MKKHFKYTILSMVLMGITSSTAFAVAISSKPLKGSVIKGHIPYIKSIGTRVVLGGELGEDGNIKVSVGDVIEVPTHLNASELAALGLSSKLFDFFDDDGDVVASLGKKIMMGGQVVDAKREFKIEWFALSPKAGNSWENIKSWDELDAQSLDGRFYENNTVSKALVIPAAAGGKRIGFIATPTSENGVPYEGAPIKAFDIGYFWKQNAPSLPGDCIDLGDECEKNSGTPSDLNKEGGGGVVGTPDGVVNIYYANTNQLVKPGDSLFVNRTYYATIQVKDKNGNYREPTAKELETISWSIVNSETEAVVETYTKANPRVKTVAANGVAPTGFLKYEFTTQKNNNDASTKLKNTGPNFSEQGYSLKVNIDVTP